MLKSQWMKLKKKHTFKRIKKLKDIESNTTNDEEKIAKEGVKGNKNDKIPSKSDIEHSTTNEEVKESATALGAKIERYDTPLFAMMSGYMKIFTKSKHTKEELEETIAIHYHINNKIENRAKLVNKIVNKFRNLQKRKKQKVINKFVKCHETKHKIDQTNVNDIIDLTGNNESEDDESEDVNENDSDFTNENEEEESSEDNDEEIEKEYEKESEEEIGNEEGVSMNKEILVQNINSVEELNKALWKEDEKRFDSKSNAAKLTSMENEKAKLPSLENVNE